MNEDESANGVAALPAVSSTDWLDALKWHMQRMKSVEEKYRREADDAIIKADVMRSERIELENRIARTQKRI